MMKLLPWVAASGWVGPIRVAEIEEEVD